jgi:hypothetical protein
MRPEKVASCMYRQFTTDFAKQKSSSTTDQSYSNSALGTKCCQTLPKLTVLFNRKSEKHMKLMQKHPSSVVN